MSLVMIDIMKITLVLYTDMTKRRVYIDMLEVYIMTNFKLIKYNTCVKLHMSDIVRTFGHKCNN